MNKTIFSCESCGHQAPKWLGKCPECGNWNSFIEESISKKDKSLVQSKIQPIQLSEVVLTDNQRFSTGIHEFDRVMGGGITKGSLTLIGGEPGIGKSTLLLEICGRLGSRNSSDIILYISGEESEIQILKRSQRLGIKSANIFLYHQNIWEKILDEIKKSKPTFIILDSIQTTISKELNSPAGTVSQIREVTYELMNYAKSKELTCFIVGHITKDGTIAGPKLLEHMVDTVVYFEGDQTGHYRILRSIKNRFGNTNEVGLFEMREDGLCEIINPSHYFLDFSIDGSFGRSITSIVEGTRVLFVEIQALVIENKFTQGKRVTQGLDNNRVALLVAVIDKYLGLPLSYQDMYVNVVGGLKITGRETDLAIMTSLISSFTGKPLPEKSIFLGEVGLTGEIRSVPWIENRLKECQQMNYQQVYLSTQSAKKFNGKFNLKLIGLEKAIDVYSLIFKDKAA
jgi:DNA repair protein RadA/Sms